MLFKHRLISGYMRGAKWLLKIKQAGVITKDEDNRRRKLLRCEVYLMEGDKVKKNTQDMLL